MFVQVCAVGNSWVSHASGSYVGFQLLQFSTLSFGLSGDVGTFHWLHKRKIQTLLVTQSILYCFLVSSSDIPIALVCLFREEESSVFLVGSPLFSLGCVRHMDRGGKKKNEKCEIASQSWRDSPETAKVHTQNIHPSSLCTLWALSPGVPVCTSWVMCLYLPATESNMSFCGA